MRRRVQSFQIVNTTKVCELSCVISQILTVVVWWVCKFVHMHTNNNVCKWRNRNVRCWHQWDNNLLLTFIINNHHNTVLYIGARPQCAIANFMWQMLSPHTQRILNGCTTYRNWLDRQWHVRQHLVWSTCPQHAVRLDMLLELAWAYMSTRVVCCCCSFNFGMISCHL